MHLFPFCSHQNIPMSRNFNEYIAFYYFARFFVIPIDFGTKINSMRSYEIGEQNRP